MIEYYNGIQTFSMARTKPFQENGLPVPDLLVSADVIFKDDASTPATPDVAINSAGHDMQASYLFNRHRFHISNAVDKIQVIQLANLLKPNYPLNKN